MGMSLLAQNKNKTLFTINNEITTIDDFKRVYEKNLNVIQDEESKDVSNNLALFINFKLKVKQAYDLKLDTLASYQREIEIYKNQLMAPYLQDEKLLNKLVEEAYFRTQNEVNVSHILIKLSETATPNDTLIAYNKIMEARSRILKGDSFENVAKEVSEDPSAKTNGGSLGYFGAFNMVYSFENAAYKTTIGSVSMPFKTRFGYHILKANSIRKSLGEIEVAHILISDTSAVGKSKIEEVYLKLEKGTSFEDLAKEYSMDVGSKDTGGKLRKFGTGRMVKPFEEASFALREVSEYSKPFKTRFGYHIVTLIEQYPVLPFDEIKEELHTAVKKNGRSKLSVDAILNRLKREYKIRENETTKALFNRPDFREMPYDSLQETLLTINEKKIKLVAFVKDIQNRRQKDVPVLFEMFKDAEILAYFKENLVNTEPEYAYSLSEYKDGILLFDLMQEKIWNKSSNDSIGLKSYFDTNVIKYNSKDLEKIKGEVISDYQTYLEDKWVADLRTKNKVEINKKALKKVLKYYKKKQ
jgi:peptidyl-prolyl cis-trans isomerase SurA